MQDRKDFVANKALKRVTKCRDPQQIIVEFEIGDVDSFRQFFESFYPSLRLFANKYLNDHEASHDIVQDAFLYIWNKKDLFHSIVSVKSYLFKYVKDRSLNYLRKRKKRKILNTENLNSEIFFRDVLIEEEVHQTIYKAVKNLSPQGRKVIELSLDGLKNQEIAERLVITINSVKTIKKRAFNSMRKELEKNILLTLFYIHLKINSLLTHLK